MSITRNRRYYSGFKKSLWWSQKRERLYKERGGICERCREKKSIIQLTLHHIVPKSMGGRDIDANLILLCAGCHSEKHEKTITNRDDMMNQHA